MLFTNFLMNGACDATFYTLSCVDHINTGDVMLDSCLEILCKPCVVVLGILLMAMGLILGVMIDLIMLPFVILMTIYRSFMLLFK